MRHTYHIRTGEEVRLDDIKALYERYVLPTYSKQDLCLVEGTGSTVRDSEGREYLDFFPGWAVSGIGHSHPRVIERMIRQSRKILHVSNNFYNELQPVLARKIIEHSFPGKVFFANSGAEANEAAIKLARRHGGGERFEIITMERSFHGRTLATLTATGQEKVKKGFYPLPEGFKHVPFNDLKALRNAVTPETAAVMLEPVQGEGGINPAGMEYMRGVRQLCDDNGMLLIFDEVQTGMGRTGEMFAYRHFNIEPDAMTLAKSLGGGLPIGALVAADAYKDVLGPGSHASTFGGSPIVCSAALGVFEAIEEDELLRNVRRMGEYLVNGLRRPSSGHIRDIKGLGLMIGVELNAKDGSPVVERCARQGLLINCTQKNVLRIMPPMTVTEEEIDRALRILFNALEAL
jgi:predicted acetylornithine/succinylornithine family transaminase